MIDIVAPVSTSARTGMPSTSSSNKLYLVGRVKRGFPGQVENAASPLGAAFVSFPERSVRRWSEMKVSEAAANETDDGVVRGSGRIGTVKRRWDQLVAAGFGV